jgi:hypothetical protein
MSLMTWIIGCVGLSLAGSVEATKVSGLPGRTIERPDRFTLPLARSNRTWEIRDDMGFAWLDEGRPFGVTLMAMSYR